MEQRTPYLLTGSGDGPYEIRQENKAVALLRNTTFEVATHIVKCLNSQPILLMTVQTAATDIKDWLDPDGEFEVSEQGLRDMRIGFDRAIAKATQ